MIETGHVFLIIIGLLGLVAAIFDSVIWSIFICFSFVAGKFWGIDIANYIINWLRKYFQSQDDKPGDNGTCRVCSGTFCKRHRPSGYSKEVKVPKDFDAALQKLLEKVLETYVCTWYSYFSSDKAFLSQLKLAIATAVRTIVARLLHVDTSKTIFNNLIPVALQHAEDWKVLVKNAEKKGGKPEDYIASYMGNRIHPAARSRESEIFYLRGLVNALLPHVLPSSYNSTNNKVILREILANWVLLPAIDALADPNNINFLIELSTQYEGTLSDSVDAVNVPVLQSWITPPVSPSQASEDPLKPSLEEVLNDPQLLYLFMQHIKETGPVNLLQFCLDIDDLSKRMLNPEMTPSVEEVLFLDAKNIYSTYLKSDGPEYLHLPSHISEGMQEILEGGVDKVQELRTSRPLYQAHQEAHALLEAICLPSFHHSYELYKLLCGSPDLTSPDKSTSQNLGIGMSSGVGSRLTNQLGKIRGVLRASAVDGAPFQPQDVLEAEEVDCCLPRTYNDINLTEDKSSRDLSTWRVTIPHVDGGGTYPLYMIAIDNAADNKSWTILRRDSDFYGLRGRLMEFHGDKELNDSPLPSRKNQSISFTANRQLYQDFLQKLLTKPTLRNSELLHIFLTVPNLKPYFTNYNTPDIGILYQSVAHKLRKEKGQHLDKFMSTFLSSTVTKYEHTDMGVDLTNDHHFSDIKIKGKQLIQEPFGNNLNIGEEISCGLNGNEQVRGACYCIAEAVDSLLDISPSISRFIWLVASLCRSSLDSLCNKFIDKTLTKLLSGGRAAIVVELLHSAIFDDVENLDVDRVIYTKDDKCCENAREGLYKLLPWWTFGLRTKYWVKLINGLFDPLQSPAFNKHLAYVLVDQAVAKLFPEISR